MSIHIACWDFKRIPQPHQVKRVLVQALMLPEAVRLLHLLISSGKRVYVHCTAGINRATLTTVGYLTFLKVDILCKLWLLT